jgi:hypothetical protein
MTADDLFPLRERPIPEHVRQQWDAWLASECYQLLINTLASEARRIAIEAMSDSVRLADAQRSVSSSMLAEAIDRRDRSWQEVKWLLNAITMLEAIREGKLEPRNVRPTHEPLA